jgi:NAD(P)H-dependent flavin oxidoreductase YrpB (nitropropane dioxygenase family)
MLGYPKHASYRYRMPPHLLLPCGDGKMLKTRLCELFCIEVPIILTPMGTCTSAELAAAVSNEGGLGRIGSLFRPTAAVKRDIDAVRNLTSRPFAINHILQTLSHHVATNNTIERWLGNPAPHRQAVDERRRYALCLR